MLTSFLFRRRERNEPCILAVALFLLGFSLSYPPCGHAGLLDQSLFTINPFVVDDDLDVYLNGTLIYTDGNALSGQRAGFSFRGKTGDTLRFVVRDTYGHCSSLSPLVLVCAATGQQVQLDPGYNQGCGLPGGNRGVQHDASFAIPDFCHDTDLSLAMTEDHQFTTNGWQVSYTLQVMNTGSQDVTGVILRDTLPNEVVYVSASGAGATCALSGHPPDQGGGFVLCTGISVPAQGEATIILVTKVTNASDLGSNKAEVNPAPHPITETDYTNNTADLIARLPLLTGFTPEDTWRALSVQLDLHTSLTGNDRNCVGWQKEILDHLDALRQASPELFILVSYGPITDQGHNGVVVYLNRTNYHTTGIVIHGTAALSQYNLPGMDLLEGHGTWADGFYQVTPMPLWQGDKNVHQVDETVGHYFEGTYPGGGTGSGITDLFGCSSAPNAMEVSTHSPIEIRLTNAQGQHVQTENGRLVVNDLAVPFFAYKFWNPSNSTFDWDLVLPNDVYRIELVGTATGPYTLTLTTFTANGKSQQTIRTGMTTLGQVDQFTFLLGDLNGDGQVDCSDLALVKAAFGKRSGQPGFDLRADTNGDGVINVKDLAYVAQKVPAGTRCP